MNTDPYIPIGFPAHLIARVYLGALSHRLKHLEIERHYYCLVAIDNAKKTVTQKELGQILGVDKVTMGRMIDYLSGQNYVVRSQNSEDRRAHAIQLTAKAIQIVPEIKDAICKINKAALENISKEETAAFLNIAARIHSNLTKLPLEDIQVQYKKISGKKKIKS